MTTADPVLRDRHGFVVASHVYFIGGAGLVKIGFTQDLRVRVRALQADSPVELELIRWVECQHFTARPFEELLHGVFATYRRRGEWFDLPEGWEDTLDALLDWVGVDGRCNWLDSSEARCPSMVSADQLGCRAHWNVLRPAALAAIFIAERS